MENVVSAGLQSTVTIEEQRQLDAIENGLAVADRFINKNYLLNMNEQKILALSEEDQHAGELRLLKLNKFIYDKDENINDKLISVYSALENINSTAFLMVCGKREGISIYLGTRLKGNGASIAKQVLEKSFLGNFPGSDLENIRSAGISEIMNDAFGTEKKEVGEKKRNNVSSVTVIPSLRGEGKHGFVQGLEKFIDTMQGESYTAILIARPAEKKELEWKKRGYEELYSVLSPFMKTTLAHGENYSKAVSKGMFKNFSASINNSIANTTGKNYGQNRGISFGTNKGNNIGLPGMGINHGKSWGESQGYSSGYSWSKAVTEGSSESEGSGTNYGESETAGNSRTLTVEFHNKSISCIGEKIDENLKRLKNCEAYGLWECAAYFAAEDIQTSVVAANAYKALMAGDHTGVENSFINVWNGDKALDILEYIRYGMHPMIQTEAIGDFFPQIVTPGSYISGKELPLFMGLPQKSVTGLNVSHMAEFGRNIFVQKKISGHKSFRVGQVFHMGKVEATPVELDMKSFASHCFITGSTGCGKSNTVYCLLEKFMKEKIPFLVVEPAKGEYKSVFGSVEGINVLTTNPLIGQMLKLNPFRFASNIHVLEHLDRLIEIFNNCWEMYAAMPAILKDAIEQIYIDKGWDLLHSVYVKDGPVEYPTFHDLMDTLPRLIQQSGYSSETKGDYIGALVTRVNSLTNGISGQIFCDTYDLSDEFIFDQNTIVDLSRVGSSETKSLIMGLLVLKLSEYRMSHAEGANRELQHITVLEEAHNLLKRVQPSQEGSNVVQKSVEMLCSSIAEMRTYGEGFIIVDQSPTAVDSAAIKNTNTKILMRLPDKEDADVAGSAVGLKDEQIKELSKLQTGVAVLMQNNWLEAVLTQIDRFTESYEMMIQPDSYEKLRLLNSKLIIELMDQYADNCDAKTVWLEREPLKQIVEGMDISKWKKREYLLQIMEFEEKVQQDASLQTFCILLLHLSGAEELFKNEERNLLDKIQNREYIYAWRDHFDNALRSYLELPDNYMQNVIDSLILAQCIKNKTAVYEKIFEILFGEV